MLSPRKRSASALVLGRESLGRRKRLLGMKKAIVLVAATVTTTIVVNSASRQDRAPAYEQRRLDWDEHVRDLEARGMFRRYYRMDLRAFRKLVALLRSTLEKNEEWGSESGRGDEEADVPAGAVLTLRAALTNGVTGSTFEFDGTTYVTADVRYLIEAEDAAAAAAAGATVDATVLTTRAVNTWKTKSCLPRVLSIVVADDIRHDFMLSRTQATRAQIDQGQIGSTTPVWQEIAARYVSSDFDDNRNTFCFNEVMELYPDLNRFCDQLVPEELREDHPGTRNEDGALGDRTTAQEYAAKRAAAKENGEKAPEGVRPGTKSAKDNKLDRFTDSLPSHTLDHLAGLFAHPSEKEAIPEGIKEERELRVEEANARLEEIQMEKEVRRAKMEVGRAELFDKRLARFSKLREEIEREKLRGDNASPLLITVLEKQLADVEKMLVR